MFEIHCERTNARDFITCQLHATLRQQQIVCYQDIHKRRYGRKVSQSRIRTTQCKQSPSKNHYSAILLASKGYGWIQDKPRTHRRNLTLTSTQIPNNVQFTVTSHKNEMSCKTLASTTHKRESVTFSYELMSSP